MRETENIFETGKNPDGTPWARATENVKKPQNQMCDQFLFVMQNAKILTQAFLHDSRI